MWMGSEIGKTDWHASSDGSGAVEHGSVAQEKHIPVLIGPALNVGTKLADNDADIVSFENMGRHAERVETTAGYLRLGASRT
jgi:hypothetical protein